MQESPTLNTNHSVELIVYLLIRIRLLLSFALLLIRKEELHAPFLEFQEGAAFPDLFANLVHDYLIAVSRTPLQGLLLIYDVADKAQLLHILRVIQTTDLLNGFFDRLYIVKRAGNLFTSDSEVFC